MKITQQEIIRAIKHALLVTVFTRSFTAIAAWNDPTVAPPGNNVAAPVNTGAGDQMKTGAFGTAMASPAVFNANIAAGVKLMTDGKAAFGPTAVFGDLRVTGSAATFDSLANTSPTPVQVCVNQSGQLIICP